MAKEEFIVQKERIKHWDDEESFINYEEAYICLQDLNRLTKKNLRIIRRLTKKNLRIIRRIETVIIHDQD